MPTALGCVGMCACAYRCGVVRAYKCACAYLHVRVCFLILRREEKRRGKEKGGGKKKANEGTEHTGVRRLSMHLLIAHLDGGDAAHRDKLH